MNRIVTVTTALPADMLLFQSLSGRESLSTLFEFEVDLLCDSASLDLKTLLGQPLTLNIDLGLGGTRYLNGQVTRCTLIGRTSATSRHYIYRATVRPWLWYLTQTADSKIFQQKSVPDVIAEVLGEYPFAVELKLTGQYRQWEYCVQYQETDFAFVSRLMEHEGIYYWFRHEDGKHTLVLTDDIAQASALPGAPSLPYYGPDRVAQPGRSYVSRWEPGEQITPGRFATVDYDFKKPAASLDALRSNPAEHSHGDFEIYEWMGGYTDPEQGEHYSKVRLEALQSQQSRVSGHTDARELAPGYLLTLTNHPRQAENREYLIIQADYRIQENGYASDEGVDNLYEIDFVAIPSSQQFRAPRVTPVPRTHGPQTAKVVGRAGEEIWTDEYGRVKVQFRWDRYGQTNENSSCWVRVSSPWAGGGFGGIQLPRVNDEVIVDFIGGQPDRPIVIGRVYNASNMPPWDLPGNATQSGFLSRSKDGDPNTANALMFEDKAGAERIWLHAERDMACEVEANESHTVDGNRNTIIGGSDTLLVVGARSATTQGHESEVFMAGADRTVTGAVNETVTGDETRSFTGNVIETTTGNVDETINGLFTQTITGDGVTRTITAKVLDVTTGDVDETINGSLTQTTSGEAVTRTITAEVTDTTTGNVTETINGNTTSTLNGSLDKTVTQPITLNANAGVTITTPSWTLNNTGPTAFWQKSYARGTPARLSVCGISGDAWGLRAQVYAVNAQWAAVKLDFSDFKNDSSKTKITQTIAKLSMTAAAEVRSGGAYVVSKVINLFT